MVHSHYEVSDEEELSEGEISEPEIPYHILIEQRDTYFQAHPKSTGRMMRMSISSQKKYGLPPICLERVYYRTRAEHIKQMTQRFLEKTLKVMEEGEEEDEEESEEEEKPKEKKKKKGCGRGGPKKKKKH